jgi:2-C-methyl-D-erythritol 4-phosphate cytidylyltransferase / 2-C-methyl-D-erythritol 2,4-cyclodiphosphate synthase
MEPPVDIGNEIYYRTSGVFMSRNFDKIGTSAGRFHAVIVAAGSGNRFGASKPKQFCTLGDKPVLRWSIDAFGVFDTLESLVVVCHPDWMDEAESIASSSPVSSRITIVPGGEHRQDSCRLGLETLKGDPRTPVLIHDAARPWISRKLIDTILTSLASGCSAVIPVISLTDSVIIHHNNIVVDYPDRSSIARVQTPQGFRLGVILEAHRFAVHRGVSMLTDDGAVALEAGFAVAVVPGDPDNRKITVPEDMKTGYSPPD